MRSYHQIPGAAYHSIVRRLYPKYYLLTILIVSGSAVSCDPNFRTYTIRPARSQQKLNKAKPVQFHQPLTPLEEAAKILSYVYIDSFELDPARDTTIDAILDRLDPYSWFSDSMERVVFDWHMGLGMHHAAYGFHYDWVRDTPFVYEIVPGSPAAKGGLLLGDRIVRFDGYSLIASNDHYFDSLLSCSGKRNSVFLVYRRCANANKTIQMAREDLPELENMMGCMLDKKTAYIRFDEFALGISIKIKKFIDAYHPEKLVLDLRWNSGGLLWEAIQIARFFATEKNVMLRLASHAHPRTKFCDDYIADVGPYKDMKLVVLVNENSASAAEVLSGILQDWDRAVIVGQPTYGKGLVMQEFDLSDGTSITPVTSEYHLPSGRCVQIPYRGRKIVRRVPGSLQMLVNYSHEYEKTYLIDSQVYFSCNGRILYAGMGVIPDILMGGYSTGHVYDGITRKAFAALYRRFVDRYQGTLAATSLYSVYYEDFPVKDANEWASAFLEANFPDKPRDLASLVAKMRFVMGVNFYGTSAQTAKTLADDDMVSAGMNILEPKPIEKESPRSRKSVPKGKHSIKHSS